MVFSSVTFLFYFLPLVLCLYFVSGKMRNLSLLFASLAFYTWGEVTYAFLLAGSIALNYLFGAWIGRRSGRTGRVGLGLGIACNLALLGAFKYADFLVQSINPFLGSLGMGALDPPAIHLPLGISFFTFQAMSYLIDVYRGEAHAEKNPLTLALYISMFPQLVAGPIVRFGLIQGDLHQRSVTTAKIAAGVHLFVVGLAQKVIIANTMAVPADRIFALPPAVLDAPTAWLGIICYTLQIYFDFAGYSNMAIGLGLMFGFHLPRNFDYPYIARSVSEFWRRWHMTLSRWFRDYLYIPMGGNRAGRARTYANLLVVFFLCGLWHGASWTFVIWGLYHGLFLVLERLGLRDVLGRSGRPVGHVYTMLVVMVGWVLFRAEDLGHALSFLRAMAGMGHGDGVAYHAGLYLRPEVALGIVAGAVGSTPVLPRLKHLFEQRRWGWRPIARSYLTTAVYFAHFFGLAVLLLLVAMSLAAGTHNPFIYFRF